MTRKLLPLFFIIFIDSVGYFIVIPIMIRLFIQGDDSLLPLSTSMTTRNLLYSLTLMLSPLGFIICSPIIGHLSDRYGRKKALFFSLIAACIGFLLPIIGIKTKTLSLIFLGRLIAGASSSSQPVAQAGVTDLTTDKVRAFYLGLIGFAMTLAMVLGPLSGSYLSDSTLVHWFDVSTPYFFALSLSVINVIMLLVFYKDSTQIKLENEWTTPDHYPTSFFITLMKEKNIWVLMLVFFFMEIAWSQYYQAAFLTLTQHFHYTLNKMALFTAYVGLWMCLGLTVIYKILMKLFSLNTITRYSLLICAFSLALCTIQDTRVQWIMMIPASISIGVVYPSLLAILSQRTPIDHQGYILGIASTLLGIAWMITGLLAGPLISVSFKLPNILSATAITFAYLIILVGLRRSI